jgi:hypothetical protein
VGDCKVQRSTKTLSLAPEAKNDSGLSKSSMKAFLSTPSMTAAWSGGDGGAGGNSDCGIGVCNGGGVHDIVTVRGQCRSGRSEEDLTSSGGACFRLQAGGQFGGRNWGHGSTEHVRQIRRFGHSKCQSLRLGFLFVFSHGWSTAADGRSIDQGGVEAVDCARWW